MTVFSPALKHLRENRSSAIATTFSDDAIVFSRFALPFEEKPNLSRVLASHPKIILICAVLSVFSFLGILFVGVDATRLSFSIRDTKANLEIFTKRNEELTSEVSSRNSPDFLWAKASALELKKTSLVHYLESKAESFASVDSLSTH